MRQAPDTGRRNRPLQTTMGAGPAKRPDSRNESGFDNDGERTIDGSGGGARAPAPSDHFFAAAARAAFSARRWAFGLRTFFFGATKAGGLPLLFWRSGFFGTGTVMPLFSIS